MKRVARTNSTRLVQIARHNERRIAPAIRTAHDRVAPRWGLADMRGDIPVSYSLWLRRRVVTVLHRLLDRYAGPRRSSVLDAGCGNGEFSLFFARLRGVHSVIGVDFAPRMLQQANVRAVTNDYRDRFVAIEADLEHIPISDEHFDLVWMFGVIEHLDRPAAVLRELRRVVRPDGLVLVKVPRKWSTGFFNYCAFGVSPERWGQRRRIVDLLDLPSKLRFYRYYTVGDMTTIAEMAGLALLAKAPANWSEVNHGPLSLPFRALGRAGTPGFAFLDLVDELCRLCYRVPTTEIWAFGKSA